MGLEIPIIGGLMNAYTGQQQIQAQKDINKQNIQFQKDTIGMQRQWAQSDWNQVNAYNAPTQQMQRYKEAGLNPQLIYGSAQNSPSAMVRTTNTEAPKADSHGILQGMQTMGNAASDTLNAYFANKSLENSTALTQAQILNLKASADKTSLDNEVTRKSFDDLIMTPFFRNLQSQANIEYTDVKRNLQPTRAMAYENYLANTAKTNANAAHALELYNLAKLQGKLKQADVDMLEKLNAGPLGISTAISLLKMILGK